MDLAGFFLQVPPWKKLCNIIQAITGKIYNKYDCESANLGIERFHALIPIFHIVTCVRKDTSTLWDKSLCQVAHGEEHCDHGWLHGEEGTGLPKGPPAAL